jgi:hypothetical protein
MGNDNLPGASAQFGDHTQIEGDFVQGDKVTYIVNNYASGQPSQQMSALANKEKPVDDLIFYTVNCDLQINKLKDTVDLHRDEACCLLACVVHGDIHQGQRYFQRRLHEEILPQVLDLDLKRTKLEKFEITFPGHLLGDAAWEDLLRELERNLVKDVLGNEIQKGKLKDVCKFFSGFQHPIMITTQINADVYQKWGSKALQAFLSLWKNWPELTPSQRFLIFVLVSYPPPVKKAFLGGLFSRAPQPQVDVRRFIEKASAELSGPSHWVALPALQGASLTDAVNWTLRPEIKERFHSEFIAEELQQVYQQESVKSKEIPLIPLKILADKLKEIVMKSKRVRSEVAE